MWRSTQLCRIRQRQCCPSVWRISKQTWQLPPIRTTSSCISGCLGTSSTTCFRGFIGAPSGRSDLSCMVVSARYNTSTSLIPPLWIPPISSYRRYCSITVPTNSSDDGDIPSTPEEVGQEAPLTCSGCGARLQTTDPEKSGFMPEAKLRELQASMKEDLSECVESDSESVRSDSESVESDSESVRSDSESVESDSESVRSDSESLQSDSESVRSDSEDETYNQSPDRKNLGKSGQAICRRCFSLKHYNTALNITLKADDYLRHLAHLKEKRALILLMIDVTDFPGSLFPSLNTLLSLNNPVMIVANKIDLLPKELQPQFWKTLESVIINECQNSSLDGCRIAGVQFISAESGEGVVELTEAALGYWGNRGDIYLLGCTNVGKSTLFNQLLVSLCGARPGDLNTDSNVSAPVATISQWPGTTLGLLSFPIMSIGKRRRLIAQARKRELAGHQFEAEDKDEFEVTFGEEVLTPRQAKWMSKTLPETEDILVAIGLRKGPREEKEREQVPQNRFWLHDTPGAINDAQLINLLTTKELKLALPKKSLKPRTFILKPGQSLFLGGLGRLDYDSGPVSAYFTVFAASYLPIHTTTIEKADSVYNKNLGTYLLKIPCGDEERLQNFPKLEAQELTVAGLGWKHSAADVILSSAGWVAVTVDHGQVMTLRAYTPGGKGVYCRRPSLFPTAVNVRGKRSQKGNRSAFTGRKGKKRH